MEFIVFIFGPPLVTYVLLVVLPTGRAALIGHLAALALWGAAAKAIYPLPSSKGPDDWFRGLETLPLWGVFSVIIATGLAQTWRWYRKRSETRPYYPLALLVAAVCVSLGLQIVSEGV